VKNEAILKEIGLHIKHVDVTDLLVVIDQWGATDSPADVNEDGTVDVTDLLIVVGNWGPCE
jgi:hypothetical protein